MPAQEYIERVYRSADPRFYERILFACAQEEYPVCPHTQERNLHAIALYHSLCFRLVQDPVIGSRRNDILEALPLLQRSLPADVTQTLVCAPRKLLYMQSTPETQF